MKHIKLFESWEQPEGTGKDSSWEKEIDGELVKITLQDVTDYLDNVIMIKPDEIKHLLIDTQRDPKRIKNADLAYPIIVASKGGEYTSIIDGQHRVLKAIEDEVDVKARILDLDTAPENFQSMFS